MIKKVSLATSLALIIAMLFGACTQGNQAPAAAATTAAPAPAETAAAQEEAAAPADESAATEAATTAAATTAAPAPATEAAPAAEPQNKPITFTMFVGSTDQGPTKDNVTMKKIEEMTGVTVEFEFLVGDLDQKMGVMIASGDYPDLLNPSQGRSRYVQAGTFIDLENLLPGYPNLWKHYEPYMDKLRKVSPDNKVFLLDNWGRYYFTSDDWIQYLPEHNGPAFWVQKEVLAQSGYIKPSNLDEFFDMLEKYSEANPTVEGQPVAPFEILSYDWRSFCLKNAPQHMIGAPNDGDVFVDKTTYIAEIYQNKPYAKQYYQKLNEEYKKGMISPETFTQNYDQYLSKIATGRVLAMFDQQWNFQDGERVLTTEGKHERTYVPLGITYPGYEQWYREQPPFVGGNGMGITVKCKDVDRALQFMDFLLDEDIQKLMYWGVEGADYSVANGRMSRSNDQRANFDNIDWRLKNSGQPFGDQFPKLQGQYSDGNACDPNVQPENKIDSMFQYDKDFYAKYGFSSKSDFLTVPGPTPDYYPVWGYTLVDGSDAKTAFDQITDTENKYLPGVIMSDDFEAAWAEYLARYDSIDFKAYEDFVNAQIAERMGITR